MTNNNISWDMHRIPDEYNEDGSQKAVLTIILSDGSVITMPTTGHHYKQVLRSIVDAEMNGDELDEQAIRNLCSINFSAGVQLRNLSSRVQFDGNSTILYDGDPIKGIIGEHLVELARAGKPVDSLVNFLDKISQNPSENSREQFYDFVTRHKMTITPEGDVIAYKGVKVDKDGIPRSIHAGPGIVDGVTFESDHLPNHKGAIVTIPRSYVNGDQFVGCSRGLHVGTYNYAENFAQGMTLTCKFNPRDVVSVPNDCNFQKVRVARYEVLDSTLVEFVGRLYGDDSSTDGWDEEDEDYYDGEYLPDWVDTLGIDVDEVIALIDEGYTLEDAQEAIDEENSDDEDDSDEDDSDDEDDFLELKPKTPKQIRVIQDDVVQIHARGLDVRRVKVKENEDGTLRRATLILRGDKTDKKNRVHVYFDESGTFANTLEDKGL